MGMIEKLSKNHCYIALSLYIAFVIVIRFISVPITDLNHYPFVFSSDTWQYISTGFSYLNKNVDNFYRPPLLPAIIAFFHKIGFEKYTGSFLHFISILLLLPLLFIIKKTFDLKTSLISIILILSNTQLYSSSLIIGADILFLFMSYNCIAFLFCESRYCKFFAWVFLTFALYSQPLFIFIFSFVIIFYMIDKERFFSPCSFAGMIFFLLFLVIGGMFFFSYDHTYARNIGVLGYNGIKTFIESIQLTIFSLGWPLSIIFFINLILILKEKKWMQKKYMVLLSLFLPSFIFFSLFYKWSPARFIIFWIIPVIIFAADGLNRLFVKKSQFFLISLVMLLSFFSNLSNLNAHKSHVEDMVLLPGIIIDTNFRVHRQKTLPLMFFCLTEADESLRKQGLVNIFPDEVDFVSKVLNQKLGKSEYFTMFPVNWRVQARLITRIAVLSERRHKTINDINELLDKKSKIIVFINLRNYKYDPEIHMLNVDELPPEIFDQALFELASGRYGYLHLYTVGIFNIYERI